MAPQSALSASGPDPPGTHGWKGYVDDVTTERVSAAVC